MPVVSHEQVGMTVVIDVARAGRLRPTRAGQAGLLADLGEAAFAVVAVKLRARRARARGQHRSVRDENVVGDIAVVVEYISAGTRAIQNVVFLFIASERGVNGKPRLRRDIDEAERGSLGGRGHHQQNQCTASRSPDHRAAPMRRSASLACRAIAGSLLAAALRSCSAAAATSPCAARTLPNRSLAAAESGRNSTARR